MSMANYDQSSKILKQKQPGISACAITCAAMCVMQPIQTLINDKFDVNNADWAGIAAKYKYNLYPNVSVLATDLTKIVNGLKGFTDGTKTIPASPVIVKVNNGTDPKNGNALPEKQHWVVVTKFKGDDANPKINDFTCTDPFDYSADQVPEKLLSKATNYTGLYNMKIYYK